MNYTLKFMMLLLGISSFAQQQPKVKLLEPKNHLNQNMEKMKEMSPEQEATLWTKKMTLELDLNETQQDQMYALILEKAKAKSQHFKNLPKERLNEEQIFKMEVDRLDQKIAMKKALKSILTKKQFERWELIEMKKSLQTKMLKKKMIHKMKEK